MFGGTSTSVVADRKNIIRVHIGTYKTKINDKTNNIIRQYIYVLYNLTQNE